MLSKPSVIAVVIPCYRVTNHILEVLEEIGPEVSKIYVVDDACPDGSGKLVMRKSRDKRVKVLFHEKNQGVGGAVISGYREALGENCDVVVKLDGDGQMAAANIPRLVEPILQRDADYTKGNRFDSLDHLLQMPKVRILGNAALSIWTKFSSGYWTVNDPTNGFTAISREALKSITLEKLSKGYFFESDMLFRLNLVHAVVRDVSFPAKYGSEKSNLRIHRTLIEFPLKHLKNQLKRLAYSYYLREWSIASLELPTGLTFMISGTWFGLSSYLTASAADRETPAGQVTAASLAIILGFQLLLSFLSYDIQSEPKRPLSNS